MRVLFLTDSLSLPREAGGETVKFDQTYINILRKEFPEHTIVDCAIGGATIWDLFRQSSYYKYFEPDLVILHCGIVDCAPRAFTGFEQKVLNYLKLKPKRLVYILRKYRGLKLTNPAKFDIIAGSLKQKFKELPFFAIGILPASKEYEKKVPGIIKSVNSYNSILAKHFKLIDSSTFPMDGILSDHHHLNQKGHQIMAYTLKSILKVSK